MLKQIKSAPEEKLEQKDIRKRTGEPMIWLTSLGLTLGLLMIFGLLAVILVNGVKTFWVYPLVKIELKPESSYDVGGAKTVVGQIRKVQNKISPKDPLHPEKEWQLHVGNKDVFGYAFKYLSVSDFDEVTRPEQYIKIERLEYGDAIGIPLAISFADGSTVSADDEKFDRKLRELVEKDEELRKEIKHIEKDLIGAINRKMNDLVLEQRRLQRELGVDELPEEQGRPYEEKKAVFQQQYEELAAKSSKLRTEQMADEVSYRLPNGREVSLPVGNIVDFYYPNQMSILDKVFKFISKLWGFVSDDPREANTEGGIFPAIFGTFAMTVLLSIIVTPFGVLAAIYLREYAVQGVLVRSVRIAVNNLAGVPSIVFGVFGLGFFVYFVGAGIDNLFFKDALPTPTYGTGGILWCSLTLALMTVPVVIVATEEALSAVTRGSREASLACGASKWQTIQRIVLPASAPGILTGLILAMARGAGEVAPLMLVGVVKLAPELPIDGISPFVHLDRKFMHLGFHIYDLGFQSPDSEAAKPMVFATTLLLIVLVVVMNLAAILIREHLRKKYATGAF